jgi:hypothetical protein
MLHISQGGEKGSARVLKFTGQELILAEYIPMNDKIRGSIVMMYKEI